MAPYLYSDYTLPGIDFGAILKRKRSLYHQKAP